MTLIDQYDAFAIDLDGVVWRGDSMLRGAAETLGAIQKRGKPILLLTNNGAYSESDVKGRLAQHGLEAEGIDVLTSTLVAIHWIESNGLKGAPAFVLAGDEVISQLTGVLAVKDAASDERAEVVIIGRDTSFDYVKLTRAADAIRMGAAFVALNRDLTMPVSTGLVPGTGAFVAAVEAASGARAVVLGKPQPPMMQMAVEKLGSQNVLLVGDRLDSDIAGAKSVGWDSALVLSGVTEHGGGLDPSPDYVIISLAELVSTHGCQGSL